MIVLTCRTSVAGMVNRGKARIIWEACVLLARTIDVMSVLFIYREHRRITTHLVRRCFAIANKELQINEEIRDKEVRVIGADGEQLGIMSSRDAYNMAQ